MEQRILLADPDEAYVKALSMAVLHHLGRNDSVRLWLVCDVARLDQYLDSPRTRNLILLGAEDKPREMESTGWLFCRLDKTVPVEEMAAVLIRKIRRPRIRPLTGDTCMLPVCSAQGGCGKTVLALNLARSMGIDGCRVCYVNLEMLQTFERYLGGPFFDGWALGQRMAEEEEASRTDSLPTGSWQGIFDYQLPGREPLFSYGISAKRQLEELRALSASGHYDLLIIDMGTGLWPHTEELLLSSAAVCVVSGRSLGSRSCRARLQSMLTLGWQGEVIVIENAFRREEALAEDDPFCFCLPYAPRMAESFWTMSESAQYGELVQYLRLLLER